MTVQSCLCWRQGFGVRRKGPLPASPYSPNKFGEIEMQFLPQLVGEVPEGGWGPYPTPAANPLAQAHWKL
jgi:hypothetical protein